MANRPHVYVQSYDYTVQIVATLIFLQGCCSLFEQDINKDMAAGPACLVELYCREGPHSLINLFFICKNCIISNLSKYVRSLKLLDFNTMEMAWATAFFVI